MTFGYVRPASLHDAVVALADGDEDARPIAGGQSLLPMVNLGLAVPSMVVDLSRLDELRGITERVDGLAIGAGTLHVELVESEVVARHAPLLAAAAGWIGSPRIRNRGTIGGSLAHADPLAELPLACWALDATVTVLGPGGERTVAAEDLSLGYYMTTLDDGEVITSIQVPTQRHRRWGFHEYSRRMGDFAIAAVAANLDIENDTIRDARVVVAGVADRPARLSRLETDLVGRPPDEAIAACEGVDDEVSPHDNAYVPAAYRRRLVGTLTRRAITDATTAWEAAA